MIQEYEKDIAQRALEKAMKYGCDGCRVTLKKGTENELEVRDGKTDRLHHSSGCQLTVNLYADGKYSSVSTNKISDEEISRLIRNGIKNCQCLMADPYRLMPESQLYYKGNDVEMGLYDHSFSSITPEMKLTTALSAIDEMKDPDGNVITASAMVDDYEAHTYIISSNGFEGMESRSSYALSASISVRDEGDSRPEAWWYISSPHWDTMRKKGIGETALRRALRKRGSRKTRSGRYTMIVETMVVSQLLAPMIGAMKGEALQQQSSFLTGKKGEAIASPQLTLTDNPLLTGHPGARCFDAEGIALRPMTVIENGVLCNYYISHYIGRKMGVEPTTGATSILLTTQGTESAESMIASCGHGLFVTGFNGGNCNGATGDFSYGIEGFVIENGGLTAPFSEMIVTGNMLTLWKNLSKMGNDAPEFMAWSLPTMQFEDVAVS